MQGFRVCLVGVEGFTVKTLETPEGLGVAGLNILYTIIYYKYTVSYYSVIIP